MRLSGYGYGLRAGVGTCPTVNPPTIIRRADRGNTLIMVAVFLASLIGFAAISIDIGNVLMHRHKMHERTDAVALAAVHDWASGINKASVRAIGRSFAIANGLSATNAISIEPGLWNRITKQFQTVASDPLNPLLVTSNVWPAVKVVEQKTIRLGFGAVVGFGAMQPQVESIAAVTPAFATTKLLPFAACSDVITQQLCAVFTLHYTQVNSGTNSCGDSSGPANFGALAITAPGAGNPDAGFRDAIANGVNQIIRVGDCVATLPGEKTGPLRQGLDDRLRYMPIQLCPPIPDDTTINKRLVIVPKVDSLQVNGRGEVCITGFYTIALESYDQNTKLLTARFVRIFAGAEVNPNATFVPGELLKVAIVK
jgi:hypothetical protein